MYIELTIILYTYKHIAVLLVNSIPVKLKKLKKDKKQNDKL